MKYSDSVRRAGRSLRNAKGRTILTSLAIGVGAFTITLALAAGSGIRNLVDDALNSNVNPRSVQVSKSYDIETAFGGGESIAEYDENTESAVGSPNDVKQYTVSKEQVDKVAALKEVDRVTVVRQTTPKYIALEGSDSRYVINMASTYDPDILLDEVAGDLPELTQPLPEGTVVISEDLAKKFGDPADVVGKSIDVMVANVASGEEKLFSYPIIAVAKPGSFSFVSGELYLSNSASEEVNDFASEGTEMFERYYAFAAVTASGYEPEQVRDAVEAADDTLDAQTAEEVSQSIFQVVNIAQYVVVGFGTLALLAAVFGIINTQYISVLERTREIGLMKALGMRGRHVRRLFQLEAAWIGALGGVIGALLAWGVGALLNPWISEQLKLEENDLLVFEIIPIVVLVVALALTAMIAGWFPSRKASKLDPIEALRTE